jgi:hypothetical protein
MRKESVHDLPGDMFRMLGKEVAYLKLSSVTAAKVAGHTNV